MKKRHTEFMQSTVTASPGRIEATDGELLHGAVAAGVVAAAAAVAPLMHPAAAAAAATAASRPVALQRRRRGQPPPSVVAAAAVSAAASPVTAAAAWTQLQPQLAVFSMGVSAPPPLFVTLNNSNNQNSKPRNYVLYR